MSLQTARYQSWIPSLIRFLPRWSTTPIVMIAAAQVAIADVPKAVPQAKKPSVVAVVNAEPITRKALSDSAVQRYGTDVLDNMVNRHLILQECQQRGIQVTQQQVNAEINRTASKFGLSMESYLKMLKEERDIDANQLSREVIWPLMALRALVADKVQITDEEFNRAFLAQYGEAVKCRLIMTADRSKALQLHQQATAKPDTFANLAKQFSEDESSASVGGLIRPIRRYNGDSRLEEAAFGLQNGQVSEVLQLGDQWVILQAVRRIPAATPRAEAMPVVKEQISDRIRDKKTQGAGTELFEKLQNEAQVVKIIGDPKLSNQYPGAAALINGQQLPVFQVAQECVKRYGDEVLEGEINRKVLAQALRSVGKKVTDADLQAEIARAAASYGIVRPDGTPDLEAWMESVTTNSKVTEAVYIADSVWPSVALKKLVEETVQVTADDMREGFESSYGPRVEILAIVLSDQRSAQQVWEMVRDNPTDAFFGQMAAQYSVEPVSSSNMGKVPPIRKHSGQPAVEKEAFSLKPGELSGIIATGGKYIILRCQGFTEPVVSDPAAVQQELIRDLTDKKTRLAMVERLDSLLENAEIDNFFSTAAKPSGTTTR